MSNPVLLTVHPEKASQQISRHIYGHFAEHLGWGIYGGIYVGENSNIANVDGLRLDVIEALKKIAVPNLRWPGGCFADTYHWRDGIGPKKQRPSIVNTWWGGVSEDNSFGTHDFLNLCELLGAEPFISANIGSGTVQELMEWVQYVNFDGVSPMSALRKMNGRKDPWRVRYWGLGNEAWGCGGNMRAEFYADFFRQYATFISDWSNSAGLYRIASGPQSSDYYWTETLMRDIPHRLMEGLGLHHYTVLDWNHKGPSTDFSEAQYFRSMKTALLMDELISKHGSIMDKYDPEKRIALVVDEWGGWYDPEPGTNPGFLYQQNTMRDAMIAGVTLNIFNNHSDRVRMANLAQAVNVLQCVILTKEEQMVLTPTYHVMDMYQAHQDASNVPVTIDDSLLYSFGNELLPALSVSASRNTGGTILTTIVNIDSTESHILQIKLPSTPTAVSATLLSSVLLQDHNSFTSPEYIRPLEYEKLICNGEMVSLTIPPFSIIALKSDCPDVKH